MAPGPSRFDTEWRRVVLCLAGFGLVGALVYGVQFGWRTFLQIFGVSVAVAGSAALAGGILGFLFGVPFTRPGEAPATDETSYRPNTSLEQVSDWLTKIIVGIGLVQIGRAPRALGALAGTLAPAFAPAAASPAAVRTAEVFSLALALYFAVAGFLAGFLWARLSLPRAFRSADVLKQLQEITAKREELDARALALLERVLTPDPGGPPATPEDIEAVFRAASPPVRVQVFIRTRAFRKENTERAVKRPAEVARTIPVFRALINIDVQNRYHRNHAQLGYALMEVQPPAYAEAVTSLSNAIALRGDWRDAGFLLYEYCRALCRIRNDPATAGDQPAAAAVKALVVDDISAVATVPDLFGQFVDEDDVVQWLARNGLSPAELV